MEYKSRYSATGKITPRLVIHGGAGNITRENLTPEAYNQFHSSLLSILSETNKFLLSGHDALDTVTFAVEQLENNPLFNSGKGAVFTRDGINELEASVMVSRGKKKRGVGLMGLRHVKNPIKLAREMLIRGEDDLEGGNGEHRGPMSTDKPPSGGAQGHCQLHGLGAEKLAEKWGIELVDTSYFFVQNRWNEHVDGLKREKDGKGEATWDAVQFVPQGTCGAVAMDADGICAVATSTGGMTNKLTGRIGDTPTLGAGFWAEDWVEDYRDDKEVESWQASLSALNDIVGSCLPGMTAYSSLPRDDTEPSSKGYTVMRSTAISGTGNGDSFLRMNAARTASAIARYRGCSLQTGMSEITGPKGELEKSAGKRWKKTGEGEGGMIGIESIVTLDADGSVVKAESNIVEDYNCSGMFRAFINEDGKAVCRVWRADEKSLGQQSQQWPDEKSSLKTGM